MLHPLTAICAVQAALSLSLVWSNTAFGDEADYLRIGHLLWAHWLHGTTWPAAYGDRVLSGSPLIYPPIGALADTIGGLAAARIMSLAFMLAATVLLYLTTARLLDRPAAVGAAALWAFSEPALRLVYATYDPLSVLFTALSAWLVVQAGCRRRGTALAAAAAVALALANVSAYSGLVIDPIVVTFAFLVWLRDMGPGQALLRTAGFACGVAAIFSLLMTASGSWAGLMVTVIRRSGADHQSLRLVLSDIWAYSALVISVAAIGVLVAVGTERWKRAALITLLGCAAFVVPAAQLRDQTGWSLDKHLAYGIWFAAIAAGYALSRLVSRLPRAGTKLAALCLMVALAYPAVIGWESAWGVYHEWPNAGSFISAFRPVVARSHGLIYASLQTHIAEYYTPQGRDWTRWNTPLSLNPVALPRNAWSSYYSAQLRGGNYGVIALFYTTSFSSAPGLPGSVLLSPRGVPTDKELLSIVADNAGEPGLSALTLALEDDPGYRLAAAGPFDSAHDNGFYAIWQQRAPT